AGASMVLAPFLMAYVLNMPEMTGLIFVPYTLSQLLTISLWMRLSKRIGKKRTWIAGMGVGTVGYGLLFFVGDGDLLLMFGVVTLTGSVSACGQVIGSSILADVIDYDESRTGQRKEGAYYSLYNFLYKGSGGVMAMIAGASLQWVGFVPNAVQTEATKLMISSLMSLVPLACILGGLLIFLRFRLTEELHAEIRDELRQRPREGLSPTTPRGK
ncbi:MAG: MFS transporter, partial [Proteobacteria bacterium]|nr:MFS transporter [Pseudomonadota bacterium]